MDPWKDPNKLAIESISPRLWMGVGPLLGLSPRGLVPPGIVKLCVPKKSAIDPSDKRSKIEKIC